jgi:hypothetical protein
MDDWQTFIIQTRRVVDSNGREFFYRVPPAWRIELQLWDLFKDIVEPNNVESYLNNYDLICKSVALLLETFPEIVEESFVSDEIERIFHEVWEFILPNPEDLKQSPKSSGGKKGEEESSMRYALSMLGVECGFLPEDVLNMPRQQVLLLTEAISQYISQKMKFQAAIHGADIEGGGAGTSNTAQIDSEEYWTNLKAQGLPIEVK